MKPKKLWPSLCAGALLLGGTAPAQTVGSDSWAATDALGRKVRDYKEAGAKKPVSRTSPKSSDSIPRR